MRRAMPPRPHTPPQFGAQLGRQLYLLILLDFDIQTTVHRDIFL